MRIYRELPAAVSVALSLSMAAHAQTQPPEAEISNREIRAKLYLPNRETGFYRGTRFDWSGVIYSLEYRGHNYYGPWFTGTDPNVNDFIFKGDYIIAGPCSAITGPVEEFSTNGKGLGYDEAKPGGTFIKIGVGVLRKPDNQEYSPYRLYEIVDAGQWRVETGPNSVQFVQQLNDPTTGYGYRYTKIVHLENDKAEMTLEHELVNTGRRAFETSVYDHNFLVLDKQPVGPDFVVRLPFQIRTAEPVNPELAEVKGREFLYRKMLQGRETVAAKFEGFSDSASDYKISIENTKVKAGMSVIGDRPLSSEHLWSIRTVLAIEPFVRMSIEPGKAFRWKYSYAYYETGGKQ